MRTLFVGDLHAKADLLPLISRVAQRENTDRMVLLGDVCDDWNVSNNGLIRFFETFTSWYRREAGEREVIPLLGNHDVPYFLKQGSSSYARVRALAPGFKPGAHRKVHELMQNIPFQLAWSDGNILATHAGLTRAWGRRRLGADYMDMPVEEVADRLNRMLLHPASLVVPHDGHRPGARRRRNAFSPMVRSRRVRRRRGHAPDSGGRAYARTDRIA